MIVDSKVCPKCKENGHDKTENHLLVFEDGGMYCGKSQYHSTNKGYYVCPEGQEGGLTALESSQGGLTTHNPQELPYRTSGRGISPDIIKRFGVRKSCDLSNGDDNVWYYPYNNQSSVISGWKIRFLPKEFKVTGDLKGCQLFGQHLNTRSKRLLITGGEEDAMAAYQMLTDKYPKSEPAVVSLPNGESVSGIKNNIDFIQSFETIIVCMDNDDAGRNASKDICNLLGEKTTVMFCSLKDASDMLSASLGEEFVSLYFGASPYKPEGFVTIDDVWDEATAMPVWGKSYPWKTLTNLTYGRRLGEGAYIGAGVKVGKSEAVNQIAHHITQVEGGKVALFKLEEKPAMTARKVAGKIMHKQFHIPDGDFTQEELKEGVRAVENGVVMYDNYGSITWDKLKAAIRHAVIIEGCQDIIIDPLTRLTVGLNSSDANTELERVADEISAMAKDLGFFYMFFCHLKAPQTGKSHEEGGKVHSNQFTGSRAMMRACYYMIGIERNKNAEDEDERNTSYFVLLEDRSFGNSGKFPVYYNRKTGDYLEPVESTITGVTF